MKYILIVLGREIPEAGMQKMPAVSESVEDGIKRDFDFSIFILAPNPASSINDCFSKIYLF